MHLGIASHNLFDIAYGLVLRAAHGVEALVEFEMLEGMANHQARAVQARAGGLLLYAPVVRAEDFHSAIAYLVRRLDENTAPENFLRHVFDLEPGSADWAPSASASSPRSRVEGACPTRPAAPRTAAPRRAADPAPALDGAVRQRARHRLVPRREPRVDRRRRRPLARARPEAIPLQIGGRDAAPARGRRRARSLAARPRRLPLRAADLADVDRALDRRPGRAAGVGRASAPRSAEALLEAARPSSPGGAAT